MNQLPRELRQLEEELTAVCREEPSPEFRDRVLTAVQEQLDVEAPTSPRQSQWAFAAAVAVSVLVWMNMSISATTATDGRGQLARSAAEVDRLAADIHELLPELSAEQTRRHAILLRSRDTLRLRPELPSPSFARRSRGEMNPPPK